MKKNLWMAAALFCSFLGFTSCSDANDDYEVPQHVQEQFYKKYPNAKSVKWAKQQGYTVATFIDGADAQNSQRCAAWFSPGNGLWDMTEVEKPYAALPLAVRLAFEASKYAAAPWEVDDEIDVLERNGVETLYIISVENQLTDLEMELYYSADGLLVKEVLDDAPGGNHAADFLPEMVSVKIKAWIDEHYHGARVIDIDVEDGGVDVKIVHNHAVFEIHFSSNEEWIYTKQEVGKKFFSELPPIILSAIRNLPGFSSLIDLDEVDIYISAKHGKFFYVEIETDDAELSVYIGENGLIIDKPVWDEDGSNVCVNKEVRQWIAKRYPNALIVGREYDDGLMEVDFWHEKTKKTAYFYTNGKWIRTEWDVRYADVPAAVLKTLQERYPDYKVDRDDIEAVDSASGLVLKIEIENPITGQELHLTVDLYGKVLREL